jgi:hypothetical protein
MMEWVIHTQFEQILQGDRSESLREKEVLGQLN